MIYTYVEVFRAADGYDCTNNGISSKNTHLYLFDGDRDACIEEAKAKGIEDKAIYLNKRSVCGEKHYFAEPLIEPKVDGPHMFGGNFVYSCSAEFARMCKTSTSVPLPIHDRYETWGQYDALSR